MIRFPRGSVGLLAAALAILAFQASPSAHHRWKRYHWARTANPFTIDLGKNLTSPWSTGTYLATASADWSQSDVLDTTIVTGGTTPSQCDPTSGRVLASKDGFRTSWWDGSGDARR